MTFKLPESMGFMWQHDETGRCGFSESNQREMWAKGNPRLHIIDDIYSKRQLIQALKDWTEALAVMTEAGVLGHGECADAIRNKAKELA